MTIEWSIHVAGAGDVRAELDPDEIGLSGSGSKLGPVLALAARLIEEYFGRIEFSRCAYGNEFCENLIPGPAAVQAVLEAAREHGLPLTLLTPYVSDEGIAALKPIFELLGREASDARAVCEVVFNDWGVLNVLRRDFPGLIPVQGRLLNKSLRDPRINGIYPEASASLGPQTALVNLRRTNLDSSGYIGFIRGMGVSRIEVDNLPQGIDLDQIDRRVAVGVYVPFGFVATSRSCMAAGLHYPKRDKFQPGAPCRHECQTHLLEYTYTNSPFNNRDQKFYLKGNTYFFAHSEAMLRRLFEQARQGRLHRLIFQRHLPMWEGSFAI
jgi:hypothetical protein